MQPQEINQPVKQDFEDDKREQHAPEPYARRPGARRPRVGFLRVDIPQRRQDAHQQKAAADLEPFGREAGRADGDQGLTHAVIR